MPKAGKIPARKQHCFPTSGSKRGMRTSLAKLATAPPRKLPTRALGIPAPQQEVVADANPGDASAVERLDRPWRLGRRPVHLRAFLGVLPMSARRKFLYACLTTAVFLLAIEGAARLIWIRLEVRAFRQRRARGEEILGPQHNAVNFIRMAHGIYGWTLRPNSQEGDVFINAQGFHQRDTIPLQRRSGYFRVACLGESTTFRRTIHPTRPH